MFFAEKLIVFNQNTADCQYTGFEVWSHFVDFLNTIKGGVGLFDYDVASVTFRTYFDIAHGASKSNGVYRGFRIVPKCEWESHIGYISEYSDSESEADDPMTS